MSNIDDIALNMSPWSPSKVKCLEKCPLQFYMKYIIFRKPFSKSDNSLQTTSGSAVHSILEYLLLGYTLSKAEAIAKVKYVPTNMTASEWNENVMVMAPQMVSFNTRIETFSKKHKIKKIHVEKKMAVDADFNPVDFWDKSAYFRVVSDMIIELENSDYIILDHKTGAPASMGLYHFTPQLDANLVVAKYHLKLSGSAKVGVHFVNDGVVTMSDLHTDEVITGNMKNSMYSSIYIAVDNVLLEKKMFRDKKSSACTWCDYRDECRMSSSDHAAKVVSTNSVELFSIPKLKKPRLTAGDIIYIDEGVDRLRVSSVEGSIVIFEENVPEDKIGKVGSTVTLKRKGLDEVEEQSISFIDTAWLNTATKE